MRNRDAFIIYFIVLLTISILFFGADASDKPDYYNVFNQVYDYDDMPTLKLEAHFDNKIVLSESLKREYEHKMSNIPLELREVLKENGVEIYLVENAKYYYSKASPYFLAGFYNYASRRIFIDVRYYYDIENGYLYFSTGKIGNTLYHEIGHALDHIYGIKSKSKEFIDLFYKEQEAYPASGDNSTEFFANLFMLYMNTNEENGEVKRFSQKILSETCAESAKYVIDALQLNYNKESIDIKLKEVIICALKEMAFSTN